MKKLLLLLLLAPSFAFAQTDTELKALYLKLTNEAGRKLDFSEVVSVPDKSKDDLYFNAKSFFVEHYPVSNEVIQLDDKEQGVVAGRSSFTYLDSSKKRIFTFYYFLKIQSKDGRCKIDLKDISYIISSTNEYEEPSKEHFVKDIDRAFIMSLDEQVKEEPKKRSVKSIYARNEEINLKKDRKVRYNYNVLKGLEEGVEGLFVAINKYLMPAEENW